MADTYRNAILAALALGLSAGLAGCSVGDDYQRPDTPQPAQWRDGDAGTDVPPAAWWTSFKAPGLEELIAEATVNNLDLAASMARVQQADAAAKVAGAALLPTVDFSGKGARDQTPVTGSSSRGKPSISNTFSGIFAASYEIDFWGKNRAARESAEATALGRRYDRETTVLTTQASVATTYFDILGTKERLRVARGNLANAEDILAAYRDRLRFGTATDLDVAQQEAQVESSRAAIPSLEQTLRQDQDSLAVLLGRLPEALPLPTATLDDATPPVVGAGLPSTLLQRRPDVAYAEQQLVAAQANINEARAALFPSITLTGDLGYESGRLAHFISSDSLLWSAASGLAQPIFHGGALQGAIEQGQGAYAELVADYRKAVLSAFQDVEDALVAWKQASLQEEADRRYVETSRRAYDIVQDQMRAGTADITTVLDTQRTLFTAEDALATARATRLKAAVTLYRVLGGGWDGQAGVTRPTEG